MHKYTRQGKLPEEKSVIDDIPTEKQDMKLKMWESRRGRDI